VGYINTYSVLELVGGFPEQAVRVWFVWTTLGGPTPVENQQEADRLLMPGSAGPSTRSIESVRDLTPPAPHWDLGISIQDNLRIGADEGWIFRSGRYSFPLPSESIEVVLASEVFLNQADINAGLPATPFSSGTTMIATVSAVLGTTGLALTATGTDSAAPGVTFTYTATLNLFPNSSISEIGDPLNVGLAGASLVFAGTSPISSIFAAVLNAVNGIILRDVNPMLRRTLKARINASVVSTIASGLNRAPTTSLPTGVVLSIRKVRFTSRSTSTGSEAVIGVSGALGAFGGVLSKFPTISSGGQCFIATAAAGSNSLEVEVLRILRDKCLLSSRVGRAFVRFYETVSPPVAVILGRSGVLRKVALWGIVRPAAAVAQRIVNSGRK
jgi:hypothetical protein